MGEIPSSEEVLYSEALVAGNKNRVKRLNTLGVYMNEAGKFPLLGGEEEKKLAQKIEFCYHGLLSMLCEYQGYDDDGETTNGYHLLRNQYYKLMRKKYHGIRDMFDEFGEVEKDIYLKGGIFDKEARYCELNGELYDKLFDLLVYRLPRKAVKDAARTLSSHVSDELRWMEGSLFNNPERRRFLENLKKELNRHLRLEKRFSHKFVQSNLRLAIKIAGNHYRTYKVYMHSLDFSDLVQYANEGLLTAVDRFDYRRGNRFSTYGSYWIRQAVGRGVADHARTVRFPVHVIQDLSKFHASIRRLTPLLEGRPTLEQIAEESRLPLEKVTELSKMHKYHDSLNRKVGEDGDAELLDLIADEKIPSPEKVTSEVKRSESTGRLLAGLTPREEKILRMRFGIGEPREHTLEEVGREFDVTRERIRQLEAKSLERIQDKREIDKLKDY